MKKVLLSVVLMFAVCTTSSVMAQDVKKEAPAQKTECANTCCKDSISEGKKCCKVVVDKKCCIESKQTTAGKD